MKKTLIVLALFAVMVACNNRNNSSSDSTAAQQNLEAAHNISKAFQSGDTSLISKSAAINFIDHKDYGDVKGIDSLKAFVLASHEHIKNLKMEIVKELADDEYVMSWIQFSGTGDGQGGTMQGDFNVRGVEITKFKNGKATEHWEAMDMRDVSKMIDKLTPDTTLPDSTNTQ